jgi:hypothetical protein
MFWRLTLKDIVTSLLPRSFHQERNEIVTEKYFPRVVCLYQIQCRGESLWGTQKIPRLLWKNLFHMRPPLFLILSQMNPVQMLIFCSLNIRLNINLTGDWVSYDFLSSGFQLKFGMDFGATCFACFVFLRLVILVIVVRNVNYEASRHVIFSSLLISSSFNCKWTWRK